MGKCLTYEKRMTVQKAAVYSALGAVAVALMVVATFFDMKIGNYMYMPENLFGVVLEVGGVSPFYLVIAFAGAVFFAFSRTLKKSAWNTVRMVFAVIAALGGLTLFFHQFTKLWFDSRIIYYIVAAAISLPCLALGLWGLTRLSANTLKKLAIFSLFAVIALAVSMSIVQGVKTLWGRPRYREMFKADDFSIFSPWYKPYEISFHDSQQSFPSGHTASAGAIMVIAALPEIFTKLKKYEWLLFACGIGFTAAVAVSRIIMGAHFLSDVTMGAIISIGTYAVVRAIFFKRWRGAIQAIDS